MFFKKKPINSIESTSNITDDLLEAIELYSRFRLDGKPTFHTDMGLREETVISRAAIHDMVVELGSNSSFDTARLQKIDIEWQNWIQDNKDANFRLVGIARDKEPKSEWWFWIDQLEDLSSEQKSTI